MKFYLIFTEYNDFGEFHITTNPKLTIHKLNKEYAKTAGYSKFNIKNLNFYNLRYIKSFKTISESVNFMKQFMFFLDRRLSPVFEYNFDFHLAALRMDKIGERDDSSHIPGSLLKMKLK